MAKSKKNRDVTPKQFDYFYQNTIRKKLKDKTKMEWDEINLILSAYEFYRYEKKSKNTL